MAAVAEQEKQKISIPEIRDYDDGYAVAEAPYEAESEAPADDEAASIDVDIDNMVWEVETEPAESDSENYQEAYYDGRPDEFEQVPYARKVNKHLFTWVFNVVCGMYGVDRMIRGQVGLGIVKLLTAGGLGFWYLADAGIAIYKSYMAPDANDQEDLHFDRWGRYV